MPLLHAFLHGDNEANGATDEEIEDAVHYAKSSTGYSTYLNGLKVDYEQFKGEVMKACNYVRSKMGAGRSSDAEMLGQIANMSFGARQKRRFSEENLKMSKQFTT